MLRSLGVAELRPLWLCLRSNGDRRPPRATDAVKVNASELSRRGDLCSVPALIAKNH